MASAILPKSIQRTDSTGQLNVFILFKKKTNDDLIKQMLSMKLSYEDLLHPQGLPNEKQNLLEQLKLPSETKLSVMLSSDPIVGFYDFQKLDVIEIVDLRDGSMEHRVVGVSK